MKINREISTKNYTLFGNKSPSYCKNIANRQLTFKGPREVLTQVISKGHTELPSTIRSPVEEIIMKNGPLLPLEVLRSFYYATYPLRPGLSIGILPHALAKNYNELRTIIYGNYFLTKLKGYFTGKRYKKLDGGRYATLIKVRTKDRSYIIKVTKFLGIRNGGYKDKIYPPTGEFLTKVRIGLGYEAMLAYYLTEIGYKNAAKFYYYNEALGCMITEHVPEIKLKHNKEVIANKLSYNYNHNRYISQSHLGKEILDRFGIRFVDTKGKPNYVITPEGEYKIIDFNQWTDAHSDGIIGYSTEDIKKFIESLPKRMTQQTSKNS